ncbi:MAG: C-terminal binding protein [Luteitalea sp.]|nr:C-terminal binding protein [Luteitalea sp.]
MKVVVTDYVEPDLDWEENELRECHIDFRAHQLKFGFFEELASATEDADIVVVNMAPITSSLVAHWKKCRLVIRHGIGYDNVDVDALTEKNIPLVNIPDYCVEEVAEHAIALLFALARKIVLSRSVVEQSSRKGEWDFAGVQPIFRLKDKVLGIIGCGRIGSRIYQRLGSFGFEFLVCDPYLSQPRQRELGIETVSRDQVLAESDFITLHTPLNSDTRQMINAKSLARMKESACLINTARAGLIDHPALYCALREGRIAGAALDVFEREPPAPDEPPFDLDNVVLTPHLSWYSVEASWDVRYKIVEEIRRFQKGLPPRNCINLEVARGGV